MITREDILRERLSVPVLVNGIPCLGFAVEYGRNAIVVYRNPIGRGCIERDFSWAAVEDAINNPRDCRLDLDWGYAPKAPVTPEC